MIFNTRVAVDESTPPVRIGHEGASRGSWVAVQWRRLFAVPAGVHAIVALDGVRALAASLVFLVHYQAAFGHLLSPRPELHRAGEYAAALGFHGVSIFFVLSGFLIYGSLLARPVSPGRYLRRRARRIYPTFLAILGFYLVLSVLFPGRSKLPGGAAAIPFIAANALLLPGLFPIRAIVTVSWSLSFELCFYALILAVVVALRMRSWRSRSRVLFWLALATVWVAGGPQVQGLVRSFILFIPGILLAEAARSDVARAVVARIPLPLIFVVFGVVLAVQPVLASETSHMMTRVLSPGVLATLLLATATPVFLLRLMVAPRSGTPFSSESLRRLGVVSYSFYLSHGLAINAASALCGLPPLDRVVRPLGPGAYALLFPAVFGFATLAAFVLFRLVEEPLSLAA